MFSMLQVIMYKWTLKTKHVMKSVEGSFYYTGMPRAMLMALERILNLNDPFYSFTKRETLHYI